MPTFVPNPKLRRLDVSRAPSSTYKDQMLTTLIRAALVVVALSCDGLAAQKPNVVIIAGRPSVLATFNVQPRTRKISTPNIDQLALQGMRFTDAHSSSGVCSLLATRF